MGEIERELRQRSGATFDRVIGNFVNGAAVAWLTASTGSQEFATAWGGMAGPLAEETSFAVRRVLRKRDKRLYQMITEASAESELTEEELIQQSLEDDSKVELLIRAAEAAIRSTDDTKVAYLARLFAQGAVAVDRAIVDEYLLAIDAFSILDTPHLRLLHVLRRPAPSWWPERIQRREFDYAWKETEIVQHDSGLTNALPALVAKLDSVGIARVVGTVTEQVGSERIWALTSFGKVCVRALEEKVRDISDEPEETGE